MVPSEFHITIHEWLDSHCEAGDEDASTTGLLSIVANDAVFTRNVSKRSNSLRDEAILSAYPLAQWACVSWWRMLYEPAPSNDRKLPVDWRLAHDLASAGGGYVWPVLRFIPDMQTIGVSSKAQMEAKTDIQPLFYLAGKPQAIECSVFEEGWKIFLNAVISRLTQQNIRDAELHALWSQLQQEQADDVIKRYRILEAQLGFDPDDAPSVLMDAVNKLASKFDADSLEELVSACSQYEAEDPIASLRQAEVMSRKGIKGAWEYTNLRKDISPSLPAWEYGRQLAQALRRHLGMESESVDSSLLCDLFHITKKEMLDTAPAHEGFSLSHGNNRKMYINFRYDSSLNYNNGRRFQLARLAGACLAAPENRRWFPITPCKTWSQKMQRAFATEFLCPITALRAKLNGKLSSSAIDDAAEFFAVSQQTVVHNLANHGDISREDAIGWGF